MIQKPKDQPTYYDILKIPSHSSAADIHFAWKKLAIEWHPDRHPLNKKLAELKIKAINEAYNHLKTPELRAAYDKELNSRQKMKMRGVGTSFHFGKNTQQTSTRNGEKLLQTNIVAWLRWVFTNQY